MKKQFIFIDIDGTLIDVDLGYVMPSTLDALKKARENGHELILCTGRPYAELDDVMRNLDVSGMILCCGAHIVMNHETVYRPNWNKIELKRIVSFMIDNELDFNLEGEWRNYMTPTAFQMFSDVIFKKEEEKNRETVMRKSGFNLYSEMPEGDLNQILKVSIFGKNIDAIRELLNSLPDNLVGLIHDHQLEGLYNAEIMFKGCNKSSGIEYILNYYNHPVSQTMSIGDSLNDLDMLENTAIGICMGNGSEKLKEKADFITKDIREDGFAYAFKHFGIID